MKKIKPNSQTAYEHNSSVVNKALKVKSQGWSNAINQMIEQRYAFLGLQYEQGYLFRGMSSGLSDSLMHNSIWHYSGEDQGSHFEKELDVLLISQDFSDAYTISKIWEDKEDACIFVFKSDLFNIALYEKNAAMLATAEPGVVFRYPFLCKPLILSDIEFIVVSNEFFNRQCQNDDKLLSIYKSLQNDNKIINIEPKSFEYERALIEKEILRIFSANKIAGAKTIKSHLKPA